MGKRARNEMWSVEGDPWTYRKPSESYGKFRVRRRHRITGQVESITLSALNEHAAKDEVILKAEAERTEAKARAAAADGVVPKEKTLGAALTDWAAVLVSSVREPTAIDYRGCVKQFSEALNADRLVSEIQLDDLEALFVGRWRELKGQTKLKYRALLVRAWKHFVNHGLAKTNLPERIEIPRAWKRDVKLAKSTGQALDVEQARALLRACRGKQVIEYERERNGKKESCREEFEPVPWIWWAVLIMLKSGLRRGNVFPEHGKPGLLWKHLDLSRRVFQIPGNLMKNGAPLEVPINAELAEELVRLRASIKKLNVGDDLVLPGFNGSGAVRKVFDAALRRAGLGELKLRIHDLKHSFATWIGATCPRAVEQRLLAHEPETVSDRYAQHQGEEVLRTGIDSLPLLLGEPAEKRRKKREGA